MALGKGLKALIREEPENLSSADGRMVLTISIDRLFPNPDQPRVHFDQTALEELAASIREHGVISPLVVRQTDEGYLIIAGERRWRASRIAGLTEVPVLVENIPDDKILEIALIENVQREDLNVIEEACAFQNLIDHFGYTPAQLAEKIGKSRAAVANVLRLNALPDEIQQMVRAGSLSYGHARALLGIEDPKTALALAEAASDGKMSVRQLEKKAAALKNPKPETEVRENPYVRDLEDRLSGYLDAPVILKQKKNKGKIEIPYGSLDELDRILSLIGLNRQEEE